ncbi:TlyA family RNA methyltransferase [Pseudofrankia asymbiotica]|uniref:TlyA family RNA methyltransferase n=1 Tax=Pseudofrankia asymbiotica TaxID=1834516 RepID=UPI000977FC55|nr:TlyA family RNA methyltransferase [Pseudofrankia asymbiotica]
MARRMRLDGELVRRGLARSREQATEAIAAGRVLVAGRAATKAATIVDATTSIAVTGGDDPGFASRGAHKLLGAFAAFGVPPLDTAARNPTGQVAVAASPSPSPSAASAASTPSGPAAASERDETAPGAPAPSRGPGDPAGPGDLDVPTAPEAPAGVPGPDGGPALRVAGRRAMDVGASTGGFTDVLLRAGAASVVAVDVGYGQLDWRLRTDPRVRVLDRTNARHLTLEAIGAPVDLVVGDLSFISLRLVLPALVACADGGADFVLLVKPQFEVGRERLGAGGVVRDVALHAEAVEGIAHAAGGLGLGVRGVVASPLPGPAGNVEYLLWLTAGAPALDPAALAEAIAAGPAGQAARDARAAATTAVGGGSSR